VRLYNACPDTIDTELCEAAMAVKTVPPGPSAQPASGEAKPGPPAAPSSSVPAQSRNKAGTGR